MTRKRSKKAGLPPGTLVFLGEQRVTTPSIRVIAYNAGSISEITVETPDECQARIKDDCVTWINITGLHDTDLIRRVGERFNIHPLVLEDIVNTGQRPKVEDHGQLLFLVVRMLYRRDLTDAPVVSEQVSILLGHRFVITFQEMEGDVFDIIRNRIRSGGGRIRHRGADYLAYALLDAIVDGYFAVLERLDDDIEKVHQDALDHPQPATLHAIHEVKRQLVSFRRHLWPMREALSTLQKSESPLISRELSPYLQDVYQHSYQVIDTIESMREMVVSALESYMSSISNRMNEVMKVLTIISTIFIPLTFIAGVYGMNFEYMPELKWPFAYAATLGGMVLVAIGMIIFFKRRHWL